MSNSRFYFLKKFSMRAVDEGQKRTRTTYKTRTVLYKKFLTSNRNNFQLRVYQMIRCFPGYDNDGLFSVMYIATNWESGVKANNVVKGASCTRCLKNSYQLTVMKKKWRICLIFHQNWIMEKTFLTLCRIFFVTQCI